MDAGGSSPDSGPTASGDSAFHPAYPPAFYKRLEQRGWIAPGQRALDLGTGTGLLARELARRGLDMTGLDTRRELLNEAMRADREAGVEVVYVVGQAEDVSFPAGSFDLVTAAQCWGGFRGADAALQARRALAPGGRVLIMHYDWLPLPGSVSAVTEALITDWNRHWTMGGGDGLYPQWGADLEAAEARNIESFHFDVAQTFTHEAWRGRVSSCAGVRGGMKPDIQRRFEAELEEILDFQFPEDVLVVPHRVFVLSATMPD